ncbi:MAG: metal ABC transporter substrate-binding protein, partial [Candidatus Heimdallarchaeaceae archaeon]
GGEDPHTFQLLGQDQHLIENSDIFIVFGIEGLEPWVDAVLQSAPSINVFYLTNEDVIEIDPVTTDPNPHVWMSPVLVRDFVVNITDEVILLDFEHQTEYENNRDSYLMELDSLIADIQAEDQFNGTKVVVHHPSYMYLLDLLGVIRVGVIEEHEGSEPSAQHIGEVIDTMKEENVSIIITQPQIEEKSIIQIARETEAKLAKLTPLLGIDNDTNTYIKMIEYNLVALANPVDVSSSGWIVASIIAGASFLGVIVVFLAYFKFKKL